MAENRLTRELETREKTARKEGWKPPETLPNINVGDGWKARWVRVSTLGQADATNISSKMREGWEPIRASDHPEIFSDAVVDPRFKDNIVVGGLMACRAPQEMVDQRNAHYTAQSEAQIRAVDNNLLRENDPRMPIFNERKSTVTFGKG